MFNVTLEAKFFHLLLRFLACEASEGIFLKYGAVVTNILFDTIGGRGDSAWTAKLPIERQVVLETRPTAVYGRVDCHVTAQLVLHCFYVRLSLVLGDSGPSGMEKRGGFLSQKTRAGGVYQERRR